MSAVDLIPVIAIGVMVIAMGLDRSWAARAALPAAAPPPVAPPALPPPLPEAVAEALPVPDLADLSAKAEGWALLGPSGAVVATNLPGRAALLAGACAVLRLSSGPEDGLALPWRSVTLEGPLGTLLGEASPRGAVLAVLARRGADGSELRRAMGAALSEVERRWPEPARPGMEGPGPDGAAAVRLGAGGAGAGGRPERDPGRGANGHWGRDGAGDRGAAWVSAGAPGDAPSALEAPASGGDGRIGAFLPLD